MILDFHYSNVKPHKYVLIFYITVPSRSSSSSGMILDINMVSDSRYSNVKSYKYIFIFYTIELRYKAGKILDISMISKLYKYIFYPTTKIINI